MKIYTKTGDNGTTGLFAGPRVPKDHPRIQAYGAVDELNAVLGMLTCNLNACFAKAPLVAGNDVAAVFQAIQSDLFSIGAELATPEPEKHDMVLLTTARVQFLESCIDRYEEKLNPLANFVLPGGTPDAATLHLGRTVCRRAERDVVHLAHQPDTADCNRIIIYLNRLSDLLFVMGRLANHLAGVADVPWVRAPQDDAVESREPTQAS